MMIGVGICRRRLDVWVVVGADGCGLGDVERVIVDQRNDARDLRDHEQAEQAGTEAADRSNKWHPSRQLRIALTF